MANKVPILVVDDDEQDVFFLRRAFKIAGLDPWIIHVLDGEQALDYLRGLNNFKDRSYYPLPKLILLDVKMPKRDGFDVLRLLTRQELENLTVVMFSSSFHQDAIEKAKALGAADYLRKPTVAEGFYQTVQTITRRWLTDPG